MKRARVGLLAFAVAASWVLAGCRGGGGAAAVEQADRPPIAGEMASSNFHCEAAAVSWGGGTSFGGGKVCVGTVLAPDGSAFSTSPAAGYNLQAGFQNFVASRAN